MLMEKEKEIINRSLDAILETPFDFQITNKKIEGVENIPDKIVIGPMVAGIFFRINSIINELPTIGELKPLSNKVFSDEHKTFVKENKDKITKIICLAWWNKIGDYPDWYETVLLYGIRSYKEWLIILYNVLARLNYKDFINSTMYLVNMGLFRNQGIIA